MEHDAKKGRKWLLVPALLLAAAVGWPVHFMISPQFITVSTGEQEMPRYTCDDMPALLACLGAFYPA